VAVVNALTSDAALQRRTVLHSAAVVAFLLLATPSTKRGHPMPNTPPVIDSVSPAGPITAQVGSKVTLTVTAHDADTHAGTATLTVTDSRGNVSQPANVAINWVDGLTLQCTMDDNTPVSVSGMVATVG
jgi:hypothetical protein